MKKKTRYCILVQILVMAIFTTILGSGKAEAAAPATPSVSLTKRTKTAATIKIQKKGKVSGYQVYLKTSAKGKYQLVMGIKTSSYTIKKLKAKQTYYVKVRAFRTVGYHITFGKYSKAIKIDPYKKASSTNASATPAPTATPVPTPDADNGSNDDTGEDVVTDDEAENVIP